MSEIRKFAPNNQEPSTDAGDFSLSDGHVVKKQFHEVGKVEYVTYGTKAQPSRLGVCNCTWRKGERTFWPKD